MEINYGEDELQEIIKLNGQTVSNALAMLKNNATEAEISDYISNYTGQPPNLVAREVNEILRFAVSNGFLVKTGSTYTLPNQDNIYNSLECDASGGGINEPGRIGGINEPGRIGVGPDSSDDEADSGDDSDAGSVSVEDAAEEGSEAACVGGVEEEVALPENLRELIVWLDSPEFDSATDPAFD